MLLIDETTSFDKISANVFSLIINYLQLPLPI